MSMRYQFIRLLSIGAFSAAGGSANALQAQRPPADSTKRDTTARALPTLQVTATAVATEARRIA